MLAQLDEAMHKVSCIGLAVDETTDVSNNVQLLAYVRFFNKDKNKFCDDLLGDTPFRPVQEERKSTWPYRRC